MPRFKFTHFSHLGAVYSLHRTQRVSAVKMIVEPMVGLDETEQRQVRKRYAGFLRRFPVEAVGGCFTVVYMAAGDRQPATGNIADEDFTLIEAESMDSG